MKEGGCIVVAARGLAMAAPIVVAGCAPHEVIADGLPHHPQGPG